MCPQLNDLLLSALRVLFSAIGDASYADANACPSYLLLLLFFPAARMDLSSDTCSTCSLSTLGTPELPDGWIKCVHPNGIFYYYSRKNRLLMLDHICDPLTLAAVLKAYNENTGRVEAICDLDPPVWDAEMLVDHRLDYPSIEIRLPPGGYPMHHICLPPYIETEFLSTLAFGSGERGFDVQFTSCPFEDHQIARFITVYQDLKELDRSYNVVPALSPHIARTMFEVQLARERREWGVPVVPIYRPKPMPKCLDAITWDIIIGLLLFGTLKRPYLSANALVLKILMLRFSQDITDLQRASSLVSSLRVMTSIVAGLYQIWQHREKKDAEYEDAKTNEVQSDPTRAYSMFPCGPPRCPSVLGNYILSEELLRDELLDQLWLIELIRGELVLVRVLIVHVLEDAVLLVDVRQRVVEVERQRRGDGERLRRGQVIL
ncbi:hypothetical protein B0H10DRAFT_2372432 [Mycena sp. CBHHK59/15]|nr:hypothetical protein B0H10DRAFT_2372432 [Mycena sp. CBHHK59/15]